MKKIIILALIATLFVSCSDAKKIKFPDGYDTKTVKIEPYGLFNMDTQNPDVHYRVVAGNVVWSIIGVETVIIPVALLGWYLFEPVCSESEFVTK